jgi:hypothetical protein
LLSETILITLAHFVGLRGLEPRTSTLSV